MRLPWLINEFFEIYIPIVMAIQAFIPKKQINFD